MDYYQVLKVSSSASKKEIEDAYRRLVKESRYNTSINKTEIEKAYRILGNPEQKARYDSAHGRKVGRSTTGVHGQVKKGLLERLTRKQLILMLLVLLVLTIGFYSFRFGHHLKNFEPGDVLYYNDNNQLLGKVIRVESNHNFGRAKMDAYQIEVMGKNVWIPQGDIKARCYKK